MNWVIWWAWRTADHLVIPKPRLPTHFDRDARTEGWDLLLYIDHESYQAPPPYGHEGPARDIGKMHVHGSARAERVHPGVFWVKSEPSCSNLHGLGPKDRDDVQGADQAEPLSSRIVSDRGGS